MREGRNEEAARRIEEWLGDAEALEVSEIELSSLRGWIALLRGNEDAARQELERIRAAGLEELHAPRYAMLRDALASREPDRLERATMRLVDRAWLSALALRATHRTFERDGVFEAVAASPEARALRRMAKGEAAVLDAARTRHPMFDHAHRADRGPLDRLADLFH